MCVGGGGRDGKGEEEVGDERLFRGVQEKKISSYIPTTLPKLLCLEVCVFIITRVDNRGRDPSFQCSQEKREGLVCDSLQLP